MRERTTRSQTPRSTLAAAEGWAAATAAHPPPSRPIRPLRSLPPLIKGYLRLGCYIGDGAVIDRQFGTTDVLIILPVSVLSSRYVEHFGAAAERHAA